MSILDDILRQALRIRYPDVMPPILKQDPKKLPKGNKFGPREPFLAKVPSKEQGLLSKEISNIQGNINKGEYDPFFDVSKRFDVDPARYPVASGPNQTLDITPVKPETIKKYENYYGNPESFKNLQEAYLKGLDIPDSDKWYFMGQLEKEFIDEYGQSMGPSMFKKMFADSMASWTGGMDPTANFRAAMFKNFMDFKNTNLSDETFDYPYPLGGRFFGGNIKEAKKVEREGGINPKTNPKRFNFSSNFLGARDRATMDEQMTKIQTGGEISVPVPATYGLSERPVHRLADKFSTDPRNVQEVIWHGGTGKVGKPMIQFVNEAIERTSKVTGLDPKEVVKRMVKGSIPIFGIGGAAAVNTGDTRDILNYLNSTERSN